MKQWEALSAGIQLSGVLLFSLLIPLLVGIWLDKRLDTTPLFILIGMGLGVLSATVGVARMVIRTFGRVPGPGSEQPSADKSGNSSTEETSSSQVADSSEMEETD